MSEAKYREIVARMAIDTEFAQSVMADPDRFATSNGLSVGEAGRLRAVRVEAGTAAPSRLGMRLSKTGFGGAAHAHFSAAGEPVDQLQSGPDGVDGGDFDVD